MSDQSQSKQTAWDAEPPKQHVDLYGDPVAKEQIGDEYWEVYTDPNKRNKVFVAHYLFESGDWVQQGLDRHRPSSLFNNDWPTD